MLLIFLILVFVSGSVALISTGRIVQTRSSLRMAFDVKKVVGVQAPLGFFDPLGLLKGGDEETFNRLRKYEMKHGRIAMMAVLGHIVTASGIRCPGDIAFNLPYSGMKAGLAAFDTIPAWGIAQVIMFIGILEFGFEYQEKNIASECKSRMDEWKWNEASQKRREAVELNNGRAAQMGILGLMVHEKLNNDPYVINALLGFPVAFNQ